jgi:FMN phosphatase YigB (HAD superfamily)
MSEVTHIFFDLHNTLVDGALLSPCYSATYGRLMAERYGGNPEVWTEANRRIVADWDSYYADLDLDGENGIEHMWEGLFRTTRAMFRLAGVPEPGKEEIARLAREVPGYAPRMCDTFYDDTKAVLRRLHTVGFILGIMSHALEVQARATLQGGGVLDYFQGPIIGPDTVGQFQKDRNFFIRALQVAHTAPEHCLLVDDHSAAINEAKAVGMRAVQICRNGSIQPGKRADRTIADLRELLDYLSS